MKTFSALLKSSVLSQTVTNDFPCHRASIDVDVFIQINSVECGTKVFWPWVWAPVHGVDLSQVTTEGASRPHLNPTHRIQTSSHLRLREIVFILLSDFVQKHLYVRKSFLKASNLFYSSLSKNNLATPPPPPPSKHHFHMNKYAIL